MSKNSGNKEYKSDLFSMLMHEKKFALETYNAINNTNYTNPDEIEIITLERGVSLSIRNDASFIIDTDANYYEHQSTYNPNMPLRNLIYYVEDLKRNIENDDTKNIYGRVKIIIPVPHFVVFYNGREKRPEIETIKLSSSFSKQTDNPELELICTMYNINPGNNPMLMEKAGVLRDYTYIVEKVREYRNYESLDTAIKKALDECIRDGILSDYLMKHRNEVEKVMTLDYTFDKMLERTRNEERAASLKEGYDKGLKEGQLLAEKERKRADAAEEENKRLRALLAENNISV